MTASNRSPQRRENRAPAPRQRGKRRLLLASAGALLVSGAALIVANSAPDLSEFFENDVRSRVSRAQSDLLSLHTGLETYRIDHDVYPQRLEQLTTPIAYLTGMLPDPFASEDYRAQRTVAGIPLPDDPPTDGYLQMRYIHELRSLRIYSVGPDGMDGGATVPYDPTNGVLSAGEIFRVLDLSNYVEIPDADLQRKVRTQLNEVNRVANALQMWAIKHERLPRSWDEVTATDEDFSAPEDRFNEGETLRLLRDRSSLHVYSVGPDGIDGRGQNPIQGRFASSETPTGDIVVTLEWEKIEREIAARKDPTAASSEDVFLQALLELREETGRDNALIHYQTASLVYPGHPQGEDHELLVDVILNGWSEESEALLPYLNAWEDALKHVRTGVALDRAENPPLDRGFAAPVPNFLFAQNVSRVLAAKANGAAAEGDHDAAIDHALAALRMGRDYGSERTVLIGSLISIAMQSTALRPLRRLVNSGELDGAQLARIQEELDHIAATYLGVAEAFGSERAMVAIGLENERESIRAAAEESDAELYEAIGSSLSEEQLALPLPELAEWIIDTAKEEMDLFWKTALELYSDEPFEVPVDELQAELDAIVESFESPLSKIAVPNVRAAAVRDAIMVARRRILQTELALELFRHRYGRYPDALSDLEGATVDALPRDPFSGDPLRYRPPAEDAPPRIHSVGPDQRDDPQHTPYDPTNGIVSAGNIF